MKIRILVIILLGLILAGCGGTKQTLVVEERTKVAMPPDALWDCPEVRLPEDVISQSDVADYVLQLYEAQQICKSSLEAVKKYLIEAKKITEKDRE